MTRHVLTYADAIRSLTSQLGPDIAAVRVIDVFFPYMTTKSLAIMGWDLAQLAASPSSKKTYFVMHSNNGRWKAGEQYQPGDIVALPLLRGQSARGIPRPDDAIPYPVVSRDGRLVGSAITATYNGAPRPRNYRLFDMVPIEVTMPDGDNALVQIPHKTLKSLLDDNFIQPGDSLCLSDCFCMQGNGAFDGQLVALGRCQARPTKYTLIVQYIFDSGGSYRYPMHIAGLSYTDPTRPIFVEGPTNVVGAIKAQIGSAQSFREAADELLAIARDTQRSGASAEERIAAVEAKLAKLRKEGPRPILEVEATRIAEDSVVLTSRNWHLRWDPPIRPAVRSRGGRLRHKTRPRRILRPSPAF